MMEEIKEEGIDDFGKIKVFSSDDEKLKVLGELLGNKTSRDIIKLLIKQEMYTNEIAKKLGLSVSLVIHHIQKMEAIGLLEVTNKKITRKGEEHRFFKIPSGMLILPKQSEEEVKNGLLKRIFKRGTKFLIIGFATALTFIVTDLHHFYNPNNVSYASAFPVMLIPLTVLSIALIIERILSIKKGKN